MIIYRAPERFHTRKLELMNKKPNKELAIEASQLVVREKNAELTCSTATELEVVNALRRRALAYDLTQLCPYDVMNAYHAELIDHLSQPAPPGYSAVSLHQILRADRQAFMLMSERLTTLKKDANGKTGIERERSPLSSTIAQSASACCRLPKDQETRQINPKQFPKPHERGRDRQADPRPKDNLRANQVAKARATRASEEEAPLAAAHRQNVADQRQQEDLLGLQPPERLQQSGPRHSM